MIKKLLTDLMGSKKAMVMVLTVIALLAAKLGWDVSGEELYAFVAPVLVYLVAQGIADKGKEAAKIAVTAALPAPRKKAQTPSS